MRVLAITAEGWEGYGGIAQYNRDLIWALAGLARRPEVSIVPRFAGPAPQDLPGRVTQHLGQPVRALFVAGAFARAERLRPDLVFCGHVHYAPIAARIARRHRAALVCQTHGLEIWRRPNRFERRALEAADLVLSVSRHTRAKVLAWCALPPERVRVAPNTIGEGFTPGDRRAARTRFGLGERRAILSVSRLDTRQGHKGQDRVIYALPRLVRDGLDPVYLIAGEGDDAPRLKRLAGEAGVADRVRFLGRVGPPELVELYRAADLFALPSTGDGFGIVFLEAMACGLPALGLDAGGAADAFADGALGHLASEHGFADALASDLLRRRAPDAVLAERVQARFGRAAFGARLAALIDQALANAEAGLND